jgi:hypothetical protein
VEWEDARMDREHGATESCAYVKKLDFAPSNVMFDAAFASDDEQITPDEPEKYVGRA